MATSSCSYLRFELEITLGQAKAALLYDAQVATLDLEHVEVVQEAAAAVQTPARLRDQWQPVPTPQLSRIQHLTVQKLEDQRVVFRQPGDERRSDPGLCGAPGVVRLVLAVDREQSRVFPRDAHDVRSVRRDHAVVHVCRARERLDCRGVTQLPALRRGRRRPPLDDPTFGLDQSEILGGVVPERARAVVVGGGVIGCSVLYHLAKQGWTDSVLVEQYSLTHGSTWHSAVPFGQLRSSIR